MIHGFTCVSSTWNCPLSPDEHYTHWSRWRRSARGWIVVVNSCMVDQNWRESSDGVVVCLIFVWLGCGDYRDGYVVVMARWEHVALNVSVTSVATPYFFNESHSSMSSSLRPTARYHFLARAEQVTSSHPIRSASLTEASNCPPACRPLAELVFAAPAWAVLECSEISSIIPRMLTVKTNLWCVFLPSYYNAWHEIVHGEDQS